MEIWTHIAGGTWQRWDDLALGLEAASRTAPRVDQVLLIGGTAADDRSIGATLRLVRQLAHEPVTVTAGHAHPSRDWRRSVGEAGADRAILVVGPTMQAARDKPPLEDALDLGANICPALHVRYAREATLSVCGRHKNRLVLAASHLKRWCLSRKEACPHWQGASLG